MRKRGVDRRGGQRSRARLVAAVVVKSRPMSGKAQTRNLPGKATGKTSTPSWSITDTHHYSAHEHGCVNAADEDRRSEVTNVSHGKDERLRKNRTFITFVEDVRLETSSFIESEMITVTVSQAVESRSPAHTPRGSVSIVYTGWYGSAAPDEHVCACVCGSLRTVPVHVCVPQRACYPRHPRTRERAGRIVQPPRRMPHDLHVRDVSWVDE